MESPKAVLFLCASHQGHKDLCRLIAVDMRKAYFYALVTRRIFVHIRVEDRAPEDEGKVARLNLSLYGTQDVAQNLANTFKQFLNQCGFTTGRASPCNFEGDMVLTFHRDIFHCQRVYSELAMDEERV